GGSSTNSQGEFRIEGLTTGRFAVFAMFDADSEVYCNPVTFQVTDGDVSGLEIRVHRGATISGVVAVEGATNPEVFAKLAQLRVAAITGSEELTAPGIPSGNIGPNGSFRINGVRPGK